MKRIIASALLLLFLSGSLLAASGPIQAPRPANNVEKKADTELKLLSGGLFGGLQSWLVDLLGMGHDSADDDDDKDPVFDDGTGSDNRAAVRADNGGFEAID